ncbi:MAG TPA: HAD family phosphatase, partial [Sphingomonadales bacterium]|nr:HAD family phosphatase [Sphingomonadales bacterium]
MTIDLVIFDCDGVLVDSEPLANEELRKALAEQGLDMSFDDVVETFVGLSMNKVVTIAQDKLGHDLPDDFLDRLQIKTFAAFEQDLKPVAGIRDILNQLQDMPQKICV